MKRFFHPTGYTGKYLISLFVFSDFFSSSLSGLSKQPHHARFYNFAIGPAPGDLERLPHEKLGYVDLATPVAGQLRRNVLHEGKRGWGGVERVRVNPTQMFEFRL